LSLEQGRDQVKNPILSPLGKPCSDTAVAALLRQPALALPLLRSAREQADADQRWWIDAAIQQIEESLSTNKKP
jgi:hypothetical protein